MTLDELIAQAESDADTARQHEAAYLMEVGRAQGARAAHEAWRQRLLALRDDALFAVRQAPPTAEPVELAPAVIEPPSAQEE